ncbi:MAG: hypothetical protein IT285_10870 [Bdellovibrionales bacterium]|nr:hypothetical protein [Bdellovibrionales bacterium]
MSVRNRFIAMILTAVLLAPAGAAAHLDLVPGSRYSSVRATGMGNAFIPVSDDGGSALFYQPAAIGKLARPHAEPLNFQVRVNDGYVTTIDRNFLKVVNLQNFAPHLQGHSATWIGAGGSIYPNFSLRGFGFGILYQTDSVARHDSGEIRYITKRQLIPALGGALRLARGIVRIGYSLQWVTQASGEVTRPAASTNLAYNSRLAEGSGLSHNLGFALSPPSGLGYSLNLVLRNLGGMSFDGAPLLGLATSETGSIPDEPMTFDASFGIAPKMGNGGAMNAVLELRDVTNRSNVSLMGRASLGVELHFRKKFFVRTGWGSGYPSIGLGIMREHSELSLSWYSEEIGTSYHDERDAKFAFQYIIRAF